MQRAEALLLISKNAPNASAPLFILPPAIFYLSSIPQRFPLIFWTTSVGIYAFLLLLRRICRRIESSALAQFPTHDRQLFLVRLTLYLFTATLIDLGFQLNPGESPWVTYLLFAAWVATIENLTSTYSPRPKFAYWYLGIFSLSTLGYSIIVQSAIVQTFTIVAAAYLVTAFAKIARYHHHFQSFIKLKVSSESDKRNLEELLDILPLNLAWISADKRYIHVNENLASSMKLSKYQFVGQPIGFLQGPKTKFVEQFNAFMNSNDRQVNFEMESQTPSKQTIWWEFLIRRLEGPHRGEVIVLSRDITAEKFKQKQEELERVTKIESARLASLGEMAAGIAHEINNPLSIIIGRAESVRVEFEKPEFNKIVVRDAIEKITATTQRITKIVRSMKNLARDGTQDPFEKHPLIELVENALELSPDWYAKQDSRVSVSIPKNTFVWCRPIQISQVLLNMLQNSFQAISELEERWIHVDATVVDGFARISIEDSGPGIPEEIQRKLMQPFFTTKPPGKGTGLGLSLARQVAKEHQGDFYYDSTGEHTKFVLCLPTKRPQTNTDDGSSGQSEKKPA